MIFFYRLISNLNRRWCRQVDRASTPHDQGPFVRLYPSLSMHMILHIVPCVCIHNHCIIFINSSTVDYLKNRLCVRVGNRQSRPVIGQLWRQERAPKPLSNSWNREEFTLFWLIQQPLLQKSRRIDQNTTGATRFANYWWSTPIL